MKDPMIYI